MPTFPFLSSDKPGFQFLCGKAILLIVFFVFPLFTFSQNTTPVVATDSTEKTEEEYKIEQAKKEADLIKSCAAVAVKRTSADLITIKLGNGKIMSLKDSGGDESYEKFTFLGCVPGFNAYLFEVMGWETMSWILLDKTSGNKTSLPGEPVLSPDKKRLICTSSGEDESGYASNYLAIWRFINGKPRKELEMASMDWGAGKAEWQNNTSIKIAAEKYDGSETKQLKPKKATFLNGKWIIK